MQAGNITYNNRLHRNDYNAPSDRSISCSGSFVVLILSAPSVHLNPHSSWESNFQPSWRSPPFWLLLRSSTGRLPWSRVEQSIPCFLPSLSQTSGPVHVLQGGNLVDNLLELCNRLFKYPLHNIDLRLIINYCSCYICMWVWFNYANVL